MSSHRYSVQLRISGDIAPDEVTLRLGLKPNEIRVAGTVIHGREQKESLWSYSGAPEGVFVREWPRLEDGLLCILDELLPKRDAIQHYIDNYSAIWWCGHFQSSFDGGPTLSPSLLSRLADFGVPIFIDNYFSND